MASAKQLANQKRFAMRSKRGDFKKAIAKSKKSNPKKAKMKLPNGQGVFLVSDMPNPKAFRKKYLVVGIKRIGSRESWLIPKKQFDDFKEARKYEQKLDYGYSVHDDPYYRNRAIDQEAVAEFLQGTKDDFI